MIGEVSADSRSKPLESLPDVDRFAVVIVESIHTALRAADSPPSLIRTPKEGLNFTADRSDVAGLSFRLCSNATVVFGVLRNGCCGFAWAFLGLGHGGLEREG